MTPTTAGRFVDDPIDNPDQRIQQDIDIFTTGTGPETNTPTVGTAQTLVFGTVFAIVYVVSFTPILWGLAGPLTVFGVTVPKALFWMALVYVFFTTVVAFWIGRPLIRLSFRNELTNAAFRYALVRLRDAGEAVGLYRGERAERGQLMTRFAAVIANYRAFVRRGIAFLGWNRSMSQIVDPLPTVVQAPRLFAGEIQLGDVTQSSSAFLIVHDSLSFFRAVYDAFAGYRAAIIRLDGLVTANETARELPTLTALPSTDGSLELDDVEVRTPAGMRLVDPLDVRLDAGRLVGDHRAAPARGKTTLLRSLAQLWPFTSGTVRRPAGRHDVPVPAAVRAAGRSACGGFLSGRGGRIRRRRDPVRARHRGARPPGQPARRGGRLGQGALARRAAAHRVRAGAAGQAQGGLPRRVDLRARRGSGVRAVPSAAHRSCRTASWSASATAARSNSTTTGAWNCSAAAQWRLAPV